MNDELKNVVREFISILKIEEESDTGRKFSPNYISSCRTVDMMRMSDLLKKMEELTDDES